MPHVDVSLRYTLVRLRKLHGSVIDGLGRAIGAELAEAHVVSYIARMSTPVFAIDRAIYASRAAMVGVIAEHLEHGVVVHVEDSPGRVPCACVMRSGRKLARTVSTTPMAGVSGSTPALLP